MDVQGWWRRAGQHARRFFAAVRPAGDASTSVEDSADEWFELTQDSAIAPTTDERIRDWLAEEGLTFFVDSDGDTGLTVRSRLFYLGVFGPHDRVLQVRGRWHRAASVEHTAEILEACNAWNRDRIWPKALCRVLDDGSVVVESEFSVDQVSGLSDNQLDTHLRCALGTSTQFFDALDDTFPDPLSVAE